MQLVEQPAGQRDAEHEGHEPANAHCQKSFADAHATQFAFSWCASSGRPRRSPAHKSNTRRPPSIPFLQQARLGGGPSSSSAGTPFSVPSRELDWELIFPCRSNGLRFPNRMTNRSVTIKHPDWAYMAHTRNDCVLMTPKYCKMNCGIPPGDYFVFLQKRRLVKSAPNPSAWETEFPVGELQIIPQKCGTPRNAEN